MVFYIWGLGVKGRHSTSDMNVKYRPLSLAPNPSGIFMKKVIEIRQYICQKNLKIELGYQTEMETKNQNYLIL